MIRAARTVAVLGAGILCVIASMLCVASRQAAGATGQGCDGAGDAAQLAQQILKATGIQGGLIVHLGCGDGKLTAALRANERYVVHGLDADPAKLEAARRYLQLVQLSGPVSVEAWSGKRLPYIDNCVNLLVAEDLGGVPMEEVLRVLAPKGVAYVRSGGQWTKTVKPWPKEIDEWTHYLHDPGQRRGPRLGRPPAVPHAMARRPALFAAPRSHVGHQRDGFGQRAELLHLRRSAAGVDPHSARVVSDRPRRLQRHGALEASDRQLAHAPLAAEERAAIVDAPAGGRRRSGVRDAGHRCRGLGAGRGHRRNAPHLCRNQGHGRNPLRQRRAVLEVAADGQPLQKRSPQRRSPRSAIRCGPRRRGRSWPSRPSRARCSGRNQPRSFRCR